jgi:hypothetical protein
VGKIPFFNISIHIFLNVKSFRLVNICTIIFKSFCLHLHGKAVQSSPNYEIFSQEFGLHLPWIRKTFTRPQCVYVFSQRYSLSFLKKYNHQNHCLDNPKSRILRTSCIYTLDSRHNFYSVTSAIVKYFIKRLKN